MHHDYLPYFYSFYLQSQMNQIRFFQVPSKIQASEKKKPTGYAVKAESQLLASQTLPHRDQTNSK